MENVDVMILIGLYKKVTNYLAKKRKKIIFFHYLASNHLKWIE